MNRRRAAPPAVAAVAFEDYRLRKLGGEAVAPDDYARRYGVNVTGWPIDPGADREPPDPFFANGCDTPLPVGRVDQLRTSVVNPSLPQVGIEDLPTKASGGGAPAPKAGSVAALPEVGTRFLGFDLTEELGRGSFGRVYLARQGDLAGRPVALKVARGLFAESQTLAQLQHTNIVPIYSAHDAGGVQAVWVPYFGRCTLAHVLADIRSRGSVPSTGEQLVGTARLGRTVTRGEPGPAAPVPPAFQLYAQAVSRRAVGAFTAALDCPGCPSRVYFYRAHSRRQTGDAAGAAADEAEGLKREPTDALGWVARAEPKLAAGDARGALADAEAALRLDPRLLDALQLKSHLLAEHLNDPAGAVRALDRAVELYPESVPARAGRAVLLARAGERDRAHRDAEFALQTALEDRTVPSGSTVDSLPALGDPWPDAGTLTISFAPDGTKVNAASSALFKTLNKAGHADDWQFEILRAFQSWAAVSNLNVGLAADGGQAFGTPGDVQGDYRFGDIRIGARLMSMDTVATAVPFDWTAGTWSGDVLLNAGAKFGINPARAGTYDVFTIAAHEAGHSFGVDHSDAPGSVMGDDYTGTKAGLSAADVANVRALYGARLPDRFEGPTGNGTWATAAALTGTGNLKVTADLTTTGDVDYYRFLTPARDRFTVRLNTAGISLVAAKVTVYDAAGKAVGADVSTDPTSGDLEVKVNHAAAGSFYTVRVESARSDVFGVGRYALSVVYKDTAAAKPDPNDHGANDTPAGATVLIDDSDDTGNGWGWGSDTAAYSGRLEGKADVDYYQVTAPADGTGPVMVVRLAATDNQKAPPVVEVLDGDMNPVAARVVATNGNEWTLQVDHVLRGQDYFVRVRGNGTDATSGAYRVRVAFTTPQDDDTTTLAAGSLGGPTKAAAGRLTLTSSGLFQFGLDSTVVGGTGGAAVTLTVTDAGGKKVATTTQAAGSGPALLTVYLPAGDDTVTLSLSVPAGSTAGVNYVLSGGVSTDPVGPYKPGTSTTPGPNGTGPNGTGPNGTGPNGTGPNPPGLNLFTFVPVITSPYSF